MKLSSCNLATRRLGALLLLWALWSCAPEVEQSVDLSGTALLAEQNEHSGINVHLALLGGAFVGSTLTSPDGLFRFQDVSQAEYELTFTKAGFQTSKVPVVFRGSTHIINGGNEVVLSLLPAARLNGEVTSSLGGRNDWPNIAFASLRSEVVQRTVAVFNSDEGRGQFEFVAVPLGSYTMSLVAQGHAPFVAQVELVEGNNTLGDVLGTDVVALLAESGDTLETLRGRVVLQGEEGEGGDSSGVSVAALVGDNSLVATVSTTPDGAFAFSATRQDHRLDLTREGFIERAIEVVWDESDERFEVGGQAIEGQVFTLSQAPRGDRDRDGVIDALDNCPRTPNPNQDDIDGDLLGDNCDEDADGDGLVNGLDNCPLSHNPMQEDSAGRGRGTACALGNADLPIEVGCGVVRQHLDTRERSDHFQGSCGGARSPEVVYNLRIGRDEVWSVEIEASHQVVLVLLDEQGEEVDCVGRSKSEWTGGREVSEGHYRLVVDGSGGEDAVGPLAVTIQSSQACRASFHPSASGASSPVGGPSHEVAVGDLDGDGHQDVALTIPTDDAVEVSFSDGLGGFERQEAFLVGDRPFGVALVDVNGDGHLDIVTSNVDGDDVSVLLGEGQGLFAPEARFPAGEGPEAMALGDLDDDGDLDLVAANTLDDAVSVLMGDGSGGFSSASTFAVGDGPRSVSLGDLNGDGHLDIVTADFIADTVSVLVGDGGGGFDHEGTFFAGDAPSSVALGDLNGDGHLDAAVASFFSGEVTVLSGVGGGGFSPAGTHRVEVGVNSLTVGDLDADGHLDIVANDPNGSRVSVLMGDGQSGFAPQRAFSVEGQPQSVALGDVNGDDRLDILTANNTGERVGLLLGDAEGVFDPVVVFSTVDQPTGLEVGDVNGDGHADVVAVGSSRDHVRVLLGDGRGRALLQTTTAVGHHMLAAKLGDVNGDGHLDVVAAAEDSVIVAIGSGDGRFGAHTAFPGDGRIADLALGDMDGDGRLDIVTANATDDSVSVLYGESAGRFGPPIVHLTESNPLALVLADVSQDGRLDIVVANNESNTVIVLLGDGEGAFDQNDPLPVGQRPVAVAVGDVDGDGLLDIVSANGQSGDLSVLSGTGQGGFSLRQTLPLGGNNPREVVLGDVDGDGRLDIVTAMTNPNEVGLMKGNGQGHFSTPQRLPLDVRPDEVALGDMNGDGRLDILTANIDPVSLNSGTVALWTSRRSQQAATRWVDSQHPACPPRAFPIVPNSPLGTMLLESMPCRIERLEVSLQHTSPILTPPRLRSPLGRTSTLTPLVASGVWQPEQVHALARFEAHPLAGRWSLQAGPEISSAQMVINTYPDDPLAPSTLVGACTSDEDQAAAPDLICRLVGTSLTGASLANEGDEDVFLLEGAFEGAFIRGQTLWATLTTEAGYDLQVGLYAFRATRPLATAEEISPGVWALRFTVPPEYSGRYFAIHVSGNGVDALSYDLSAGLEDL